MKSIDFWFSIGSTYSYLTVMRLAGVERVTGVGFDWRPFSVRVIMREMDNVPFADKPAKSRYMWRDIGRRARKYGLEARLAARPIRWSISILPTGWRSWAARKAGAATTWSPPTGDGCATANRREASRTLPTA